MGGIRPKWTKVAISGSHVHPIVPSSVCGTADQGINVHFLEQISCASDVIPISGNLTQIPCSRFLPIEIRAVGLRPPVDLRRQRLGCQMAHNRAETRPRRGTTGAGNCSPHLLPPGGAAVRGGWRGALATLAALAARGIMVAREVSLGALAWRDGPGFGRCGGVRCEVGDASARPQTREPPAPLIG